MQDAYTKDHNVDAARGPGDLQACRTYALASPTTPDAPRVDASNTSYQFVIELSSKYEPGTRYGCEPVPFFAEITHDVTSQGFPP